MTSTSNEFIQARSEFWEKCKWNIATQTWISPGYAEDMEKTKKKRKEEYKGRFIQFQNNNSWIEPRVLDKRSRPTLAGQIGLFPTRDIPPGTCFRVDGVICKRKEFQSIGYPHYQFALDFYLDDPRKTYVIIPRSESKWRFANDPRTKIDKPIEGNIEFGAWVNSNGFIVPYVQSTKKIKVGDGQIWINYGEKY